MALHEPQAVVRHSPGETALDSCLVFLEHGRQVGIDHAGVAAFDDPDLRTDLARNRHMLEAGTPRDCRGCLLMDGFAMGVDQGDGHGSGASRSSRLEIREELVTVERGDDRSVSADSLVGLDDIRVQRDRQLDIERKDIGPLLRTDTKQIRETGRDDECGCGAGALEQSVGADRRAHPDAGQSGPGRRVQGSQLIDAGQRRVGIHGGVLGQKLVRQQTTIRRNRHDIGECATAIDKKVPALLSHADSLARKNIRVNSD